MKTAGKVLALLGVGAAGVITYDRVVSGVWFWERPALRARQVQAQQAQIRNLQAQQQQRLRAQEEQRKQNELRGKYGNANQVWTQTSNYGWTNY